jgi:hypothetical protein
MSIDPIRYFVRGIPVVDILKPTHTIVGKQNFVGLVMYHNRTLLCYLRTCLQAKKI